MHIIMLLLILFVEKKSGSPTIYHCKYSYSYYILITTAYYKYIFIVPYFLVIYTLLLEFHIFLIYKLTFFRNFKSQIS